MLKKIVRGISIAAVAGGALAAGIYYFATRDPVAIKVDPRLYDEYAGYYDFGHNYVVTLRREGNRLISCQPERAVCEWFPETESKFFVKGARGRFTFQRDENG